MNGLRHRPTLWIATAVAAVAFLSQIPWALPGTFLWDDVPMLAQSDLYTAPGRWLDAVSQPLGLETRYWRPFATTTFLLESLVHGGSPSGFRITAALLHTTSAVLAFFLLRRLLHSTPAAALAALAWALHPAHVETVTWIAGRFDLLAGLGILAALMVATGGDPTPVRRRWVGLISALAMMSKESAVVLPPLLVVWSLATRRSTALSLVGALRERWRLATASLVGLGIVAVARTERLMDVGSEAAADLVSASAGEPLERVRLVGRTVLIYARNVTVPWGAVGPAHHVERPIAGDDPLAWAGLLLLLALVALTVWGLARRARWGVLLTALLVSLAPVLQIIPLDISGGLVAADRYLYLPSFFFVALVAERLVAAVRHRSEVRTPALVATCLVILALGVTRVRLVDRWSSSVRFWSWAAAMAPNSDLPLENYHVALVAQRWPDAARMAEIEAAARRLHALSPSYTHCHPLAEALLSAGRPEEALRLTALALKQRSRDPYLMVLHGRGSLLNGDYGFAVRAFSSAVEAARALDPLAFDSVSVQALAGRAEALLALDRDRFAADEALEVAESRFLDGAFQDPAGRVQVLRALLRSGDDDRALAMLGDGREISPGRWNELLELAAFSRGPGGPVVEAIQTAAARTGMPEEVALSLRAAGNSDGERWTVAAQQWRRVIALRDEKESADLAAGTDPLLRLRTDSTAWDALGYALYFGGDVPAAEEAFRSALERDPENAGSRMHLGALLRNSDRAAEGLAELTRALAAAEARGEAALVQRIGEQIEETRRALSAEPE